jgi:hypothetical protein
MPKRTVTFAYYTEKDGTVHPFGSTPDLSDEEAKRGDELGAFEESDNEPVVGALTPGEGNLNVQTPATHVGKEGLTKKAAKKSSSKSGAKPRAAENAPVGGKG